MDRRTRGDQRRLRTLSCALHRRSDRGLRRPGASDAGIYVGQSENIIVRRNKAEKNVAGIEIENSINADVYENVATDNSGGILVFTMPDLPKKDGRTAASSTTRSRPTTTTNFAPKGNIVATVPPGTGMMIMANDQVEVFDNTIENNQTSGLSDRQLPDHREADQGREVRPVLRSDPRPRQPFANGGENPPATWPDAGQGTGYAASRTSSTTACVDREKLSRRPARGQAGHLTFVTTATPISPISTAGSLTSAAIGWRTRSRISSAT